MKKFISAVLTLSLLFTTLFSVSVQASIVTYDAIRLTGTQTAITDYNSVPLIAEGLRHETQEWERITYSYDGAANDGLEISLSNNYISLDSDLNITQNRPGVCAVTATYTNPDSSVLTAKISVGTGSETISNMTEEIKSSELNTNYTTYFSDGTNNQIGSYEFWFYDNKTKNGGGIVTANNAQWDDNNPPLWYVSVYINEDNHYFVKDEQGTATYKNGVSTEIKRTVGWHQVYVDATNTNKITAYLDGEKIYEKECTVPSESYLIMGRGLKGGDLIYKNFRFLKGTGWQIKPFIESSEITGDVTSENGGTLTAEYSLYYTPSQANPGVEISWQKSAYETNGFTDTGVTESTYTVAPDYNAYYYRAKITPYSYYNGSTKNPGNTTYTEPFFVDRSPNIALPEITSKTVTMKEALPKNNAKDVEVNYGISFEFSEGVSPRCVTKDNFYVYENGDLTENYELVQSYDKKTVAIRFPDNMKYNTKYEANVSQDVRSDSDWANGLSQSYCVSFTTKNKYILENAVLTADKENSVAYLTAEITDDAQKDAVQSLTVIGAMYKSNGQLISTESFSVDLWDKRELNLGFSLPEDYDDSYTFKLFAWKNDFATPLCENITITKTGGETTDIFVAPDGNDNNSGDINAPLKTLEGARDKIRKMKSDGTFTKPVNVYFKEGTYPVTKTVLFQNYPLYDKNDKIIANVNDGGTKACPITYRAYKNEKVEFDAGVSLDISKIENATADDGITADMVGKVKKIDISDENISLLNMGSSPNELVINGKVGDIARYPDNNDVIEIRYSYTDKGTSSSWVNNGSDSSTPQSWRLSGNDLKNLLEKTPNKSDLWVQMSIGSAFELKLRKIGTYQSGSDVLSLSEYASEKAPTDGTSRCYYLLNSPSFISQSGEYYIDRENKVIYFYTEEDITDLTLTMPTQFLTLYNVSYLTFKNFTFKNTTKSFASTTSVERKDLAKKEDGSYYTSYNTSSSHLTFDNLKIFNVGSGIILMSYDNNTEKRTGAKPLNSDIKNCTFYGVGGKTIEISAGDKYNLTSADMRIFNNTFENIGRLSIYQSNAVRVHSVGGSPGVYIGYNKVSDTSDMTFWISADSIIENNEIFDAVHYGEDTGAIYVAGTTTRGKVIRNNYIHDIITSLKERQIHGIHGIYLDVYSMNSKVYNNVLENISNTAIKSSGGGRNYIYNNVVILNAPEPPESSVGNIKQAPIAIGGDNDTTIITNEEYKNGKNGVTFSYPEMYNNRNWLIKFPEVAQTAGNAYPLDTSQKIYSNLFFGKSTDMIIASSAYDYDFTDIRNNGYSTDESIFEDYQNGNYQIKENADGLPDGFETIDMSDIGLVSEKINKALGDGFIIKANSPLKLTKNGTELFDENGKNPYLIGNTLYMPDKTKAYDYYTSQGYGVTEHNGYLLVNVDDTDTLLKEISLSVIKDLIS